MFIFFIREDVLVANGGDQALAHRTKLLKRVKKLPVAQFDITSFAHDEIPMPSTMKRRRITRDLSTSARRQFDYVREPNNLPKRLATSS